MTANTQRKECAPRTLGSTETPRASLRHTFPEIHTTAFLGVHPCSDKPLHHERLQLSSAGHEADCSMVVWAAMLGRDQRGACSALKPAEVSRTLLLPSHSLQTEQTQSTPPSNKVQSLAQEDLGNAVDWLLADATHK